MPLKLATTKSWLRYFSHMIYLWPQVTFRIGKEPPEAWNPPPGKNTTLYQVLLVLSLEGQPIQEKHTYSTTAACTYCWKRSFTKNFPEFEVFWPFLPRLWWWLCSMLQWVGTWSGLSRSAVHGGALPATTTGNNRGRAGISLGPHHWWRWAGT